MAILVADHGEHRAVPVPQLREREIVNVMQFTQQEFVPKAAGNPILVMLATKRLHNSFLEICDIIGYYLKKQTGYVM